MAQGHFLKGVSKSLEKGERQSIQNTTICYYRILMIDDTDQDWKWIKWKTLPTKWQTIVVSNPGVPHSVLYMCPLSCFIFLSG